MSYEQLIAELHDTRAYEVESNRYQVEVWLLEKTVDYVHVAVSVDDGTLPASLVPLTRSFIQRKIASGRS